MRFLWLAPFWLAMVLYGRAVGLPFYSDDIEFYTYLATIQPLDILTRADANGMYFRPVPMLFYYLLPASSVLWHAILLGTHLVNVALVGAVVRALGVGRGSAVLAMSFFAVFPFSVQAVLWVLSWGHVLSTTALLLTSYATLKRLKGHTRWRWVAIGAGCIAPFTHENGILAVVLVVWIGVCAVLARGARWQAVARSLASVVVLVGAVAGFYWLYRAGLVNTRVALGDDLPLRLWQGGAYFVQGLTMPLQALGGLVDGAPATQAWLGAGVFFALAGLLLLRPQALETPYQRLQRIGRKVDIADTPLVQFLQHATQAGRTRRGVVLGVLGAWGVCALPTMIALPSRYNMLYDERLLYVTTPAVAIIWGVLLAHVALRPMVRGVLASVGVVMLLSIAQIYVSYTAFMGDGWVQFFRIADSLPAETRGVVLNMPRLIEHPQHVLPLMRPNAQMMQHDFSLRDIVWTNTRQDTPYWQGISVPEVLQFAPFPFPLDVWRNYIGYGTFADRAGITQALSQADALVDFQVINQHYAVRLLGQRIASEQDALATFGGRVQLLNIQDAQTPEGWRIAITWRVTEPPSGAWVAFVHGLCGETLLAQEDSAPMAGWHPFEAWQAGETWTEYRLLDTPRPDSACRAVRVGVYDTNVGLPIQTETGDNSVIKLILD